MNKRERQNTPSNFPSMDGWLLRRCGYWCLWLLQECSKSKYTREKEMVCREGIIDTQSHSHIIFGSALSLSPGAPKHFTYTCVRICFAFRTTCEHSSTTTRTDSHTFSSCHLIFIARTYECSSSHFARFRQREIEPLGPTTWMNFHRLVF